VAAKASIKDVAALAGVSVTTVSHVLNDVSRARVAQLTRERVQEAAERLDYRPNRMARSLRTRSTSTLGLISDNIATTPYAVDLLLGAQEASLKHGWTLLLLNTGSDPVAERRAVTELLDHQAEGVLYASMYHRIVTVPAALRSVPTVLLDAACADPGFAAVVPDEFGGALGAMRHLIAAGHRRIGFVTNRDDIPATHERRRGYLHALAAAGIAAQHGLVVAEDSESEGGYRAARQLLARTARPTALFCFNDRMAMGAYRAAAELGLQVPGDLSIIGFDNQLVIAEGLYPRLTTVALPHYEMGVWAVETLLNQMEQGTGVRVTAEPWLMPCPLVVRDSVAPPR
jgi:LacI family transcriptional regulator